MTANTKEYEKIIEMELLNSIDRVFHSIMTEDNVPCANYRLCLCVAKYLKERLPAYIDNCILSLDPKVKEEYIKFKNDKIKQYEELGVDWHSIFPDQK